MDQFVDSMFDPGPHFGRWLQSLEGSRNRDQVGDQVEVCHGVFLQDGESGFADEGGLDKRFPDQFYSDGTLVVTEKGKLQADVEVTVAVIDGLFKGKIKATGEVVLENHALVIGEINTPALTIRGGAIIEGRCYFEPAEQVVAPLERWERTGWQAFKVGFARVWRGRIAQ